MGKTKTSSKQKPFSLDMLPTKKLKPGAKVHKHDPRKNLGDPKLIAAALSDCLVDGDMEAFKEILKAHYEVVNTAKALKKAGLSKRTFHDALTPSGNPSLSTVMKMMQGLSA